MEKVLKKTGWTSVITSVIFVILGIILIAKPDVTIKIISYILGGIFIFMGLMKMVDYFASKGNYDFYNYDLIYGLVGIIVGLITIFYSNAIETMFRIIIGVWIIYSGLIRIGFSNKLRKIEINSWKFVLILACCMLAFGIYIIFNSGAVIVTIGTIILLYAVMDLIESVVFIRNMNYIFK